MSTDTSSGRGSGHTPGVMDSWTLGADTLISGDWRVPVLADKAPNGDMMPAQAYGTTREIANARACLIAAAPDLLAACKAWDEWFKKLDRDTEPGDPVDGIRERIHGDRIRQTRAAIAKAGGA